MKNKGWEKILPMMPQRDPAFLTCGGVSELNTELWEWEREREKVEKGAGPKPGEAGSDEWRYSRAGRFGAK
jgi:hypothetical protein